jgi:hypothetical protein
MLMSVVPPAVDPSPDEPEIAARRGAGFAIRPASVGQRRREVQRGEVGTLSRAAGLVDRVDDRPPT